MIQNPISHVNKLTKKSIKKNTPINKKQNIDIINDMLFGEANEIIDICLERNIISQDIKDSFNETPSIKDKLQFLFTTISNISNISNKNANLLVVKLAELNIKFHNAKLSEGKSLYDFFTYDEDKNLMENNEAYKVYISYLHGFYDCYDKILKQSTFAKCKKVTHKDVRDLAKFTKYNYLKISDTKKLLGDRTFNDIFGESLTPHDDNKTIDVVIAKRISETITNNNIIEKNDNTKIEDEDDEDALIESLQNTMSDIITPYHFATFDIIGGMNNANATSKAKNLAINIIVGLCTLLLIFAVAGVFAIVPTILISNMIEAQLALIAIGCVASILAEHFFGEKQITYQNTSIKITKTALTYTRLLRSNAVTSVLYSIFRAIGPYIFKIYSTIEKFILGRNFIDKDYEVTLNTVKDVMEQLPIIQDISLIERQIKNKLANAGDNKIDVIVANKKEHIIDSNALTYNQSDKLERQNSEIDDIDKISNIMDFLCQEIEIDENELSIKQKKKKDDKSSMVNHKVYDLIDISPSLQNEFEKKFGKSWKNFIEEQTKIIDIFQVVKLYDALNNSIEEIHNGSIKISKIAYDMLFDNNEQTNHILNQCADDQGKEILKLNIYQLVLFKKIKEKCGGDTQHIKDKFYRGERTNSDIARIVIAGILVVGILFGIGIGLSFLTVFLGISPTLAAIFGSIASVMVQLITKTIGVAYGSNLTIKSTNASTGIKKIRREHFNVLCDFVIMVWPYIGTLYKVCLWLVGHKQHKHAQLFDFFTKGITTSAKLLEDIKKKNNEFADLMPNKEQQCGIENNVQNEVFPENIIHNNSAKQNQSDNTPPSIEADDAQQDVQQNINNQEITIQKQQDSNTNEIPINLIIPNENEFILTKTDPTKTDQDNQKTKQAMTIIYYLWHIAHELQKEPTIKPLFVNNLDNQISHQSPFNKVC